MTALRFKTGGRHQTFWASLPGTDTDPKKTKNEKRQRERKTVKLRKTQIEKQYISEKLRKTQIEKQRNSEKHR